MTQWAAKLLDGLNPEQQKAVLHDTGPLLVASVAGSGKTTCLVRRVAYLTLVRGVTPSRILAASFSRDAADELNTRLTTTIGETDARIGTLHSVGRQIWLEEQPKFKRWTLDATDRYRFHIKSVVGFRGLQLHKPDVSKISLFITLCKAHMLRPASPETAAFAEEFVKFHRNFMPPGRLVETYEQTEYIRQDAMEYTFDDMMLEGAALLLADSTIRQKWAGNWDYLLIDEGQDLNLCQSVTCECLALDHKNYMLIGDPSQTVYGFRGAFPEKMLQFQNKWEARIIKMHRNYRGGKNIIAAANNTLEAMDPRTRLDTLMTPEMPHEGIIHYEQNENFDTEGQTVGQAIQAFLIDGQAERRDIAVLYRTNTQSRAIEEFLLHNRIPYRILGGGSFYERREIRGLLNYLRTAEGRATPEQTAETLRMPFRFLSTEHINTVKELLAGARDRRVNYARLAEHVADKAINHKKQQYAMADWGKLLRAISAAVHDEFQIPAAWEPKTPGDPHFLLAYIAEFTGYYDWLTQEEGEESTENSRVSNAREFVRSAQRFATVGELLDYVDETIAASRDQAQNKSPNKVTLASIHKSKGLEFPVVFLIGANEKIIPHYRAIDIEEERRLFYVATTRAKKTLAISSIKYACTNRGILDMEPSRFVFESGILKREPQNTAQ